MIKLAKVPIRPKVLMPSVRILSGNSKMIQVVKRSVGNSTLYKSMKSRIRRERSEKIRYSGTRLRKKRFKI